MVRQCVVVNCNQIYRKDSDVTFHEFPVEPCRKELWLKAINRKNLIADQHTHICSNHFEKKYLLTTSNNKRILKKDAVPTIFKPTKFIPSSLHKKTLISVPSIQKLSQAEIDAYSKAAKTNDRCKVWVKNISKPKILQKNLVLKTPDNGRDGTDEIPLTPFSPIKMCSILGCHNRSASKTARQKIIERNKKVTFHSFPKNIDRRNAWVKAIGREGWTPPNGSVLCSEHFAEQHFDRSSVNCVRLRENAIPTIMRPVYLEDYYRNKSKFSHSTPPKSYSNPPNPISATPKSYPSEILAERQARLEKQKLYYSEHKNRETEDAREKRLQYEREYKAFVQERESEEIRIQRLCTMPSGQGMSAPVNKMNYVPNTGQILNLNTPVNIKPKPISLCVKSISMPQAIIPIQQPCLQTTQVTAPKPSWTETVDYTIADNEQTVHKNVVIYLPAADDPIANTFNTECINSFYTHTPNEFEIKQEEVISIPL